MAGNGVNVGIGIDYSQFEKDLSIVNKQLKSIAEQKRVISLKVNFAKTQNASGFSLQKWMG